MELLDPDDSVKGQLLRKSAQHREQIEDDVKLISERTEKMITNALIIGGALAATYYIVSWFSDSPKSKKSKLKKVRLVKGEDSGDQVLVEPAGPEVPGMVAQIGSALASQATVFLLTLAKEKLNEFMQAQNEKKERPNDNP